MSTAKRIIPLVLLTCCLQVAQAQKVDNIEAKVVEGKIQVSCTLETASPVDLFLEWSDDEGLSFAYCMTVSGDLTNQSSGTKVIVWDCGQDGIFMGNFIFKITCQPVANSQAIIPVVEQEEKKNIRNQKEVPVAKTIPSTTARSKNTTQNRQSQIRESANVSPRTDSSFSKSHFLVMAGVAVGSPISYSLTAGYLPKKIGGYVMVKSNFASIGDAPTVNQADYYFEDGFSTLGRFSVSGGTIGRVADFMLIYAGVGYGSKWTQWKTRSGQLVTIKEQSFNGVEPELGIAFKTGNFLISAGFSILIGKQTAPEANLSIGYIF